MPAPRSTLGGRVRVAPGHSDLPHAPMIDADIETILRHRSVGDLTRALESVLAVLIRTTPRPTH